jgi:carboxymethylenebutenolidase
MGQNGQTVEFPSNGSTASGYLAAPSEGAGPGVIVVQEWWGLVPQIKRVCDRLANEGFTALAPDLFHGEIAQHDEMDKAGHLMSTLPMDRAARDMQGAIDYLLGHDAVRGHAVGVVGYCMGGMLTWVLAAQAGAKVGAAVPFYGAPLGDNEPDWSGLTAPVEVHAAGRDDFFPAAAIQALADKLNDMGKDVTVFHYPNNGHAFGNEDNALGTYDEDAARQAWVRTLEFLRAKLG